MNTIKSTIILLFLVLFTACNSDLYEYPNSESDLAEITSFSLLNENGDEVITNVSIDIEFNQINVTVAGSADLMKLVPRSTVSEGVIVEPRMGSITLISVIRKLIHL